MFADLEAGDVRRYRIEVAAKLCRRIGLQIERVDRAKSAVQEDEDERNVFVRERLRALGGEQLRQAEAHAEQARGADAQEIAPRPAIAIRLRHLRLTKRDSTLACR